MAATKKTTKRARPASLENLLIAGNADRKKLAAAVAAAGDAAAPIVVAHVNELSPKDRVWLIGRVSASDGDVARIVAEALGWFTGADAAFDDAIPILLRLPAAISLPALAAAELEARESGVSTDWLGRAMERVLVAAGKQAHALVAALPTKQRKPARRILEALEDE